MTNSFKQLFFANLKILFRNWRGVFWNLLLPLAMYTALSLLKIPAAGGGISYSEYLLPGILAMTIMQTGIYSLSYWLIDLKKRGVIKRFLVTPLSNGELLSSLIATRILLMFIQVILISGIGLIFFHNHIRGSVVAIIVLLILGGSIFLSLGFLVSVLANSYEEAAPMTTALNIIFTFLGNLFFPTNAFPKVLNQIAQKLPVTYLSEGMRNNFIQNWSLRQSLSDIFALLVWLIIVFALTAYIFKKKQAE